MAYTFDTSAFLAGSTSTSITVSLTPTAGATAIVLGIAVGSPNPRQGGSPTFAGIPMILSTTQASTGSNGNNVEIWYLPRPPIGAASVVVPNTSALAVTAVAASFKAAAGLDSAVDALGGSGGNAATPTATLTTTGSGDALFCIGMSDGSALSAPTHTNITAGTTSVTQNHAVQYALQATAGAITMSWSATTGKYSIAAISLVEASGNRGMMTGVGA
jgi:hypothetical protein